MKTQNRSNNKKGFTLVELVVVIAILAVLAVTAVMSIGNVRQAAENATLNADANTVVRALNTHNALASTSIIAKPDNTKLKALTLTVAGGDLIDLNLAVDISDARYGVLFGTTPWVVYENGMWIKKRST